MRIHPPSDFCIACRKKIEDIGGRRLVLLPDAAYMTQLRRREAETLRGGRQPWICQRCAGKSICPLCDGLLSPVPGAEIVDDEGRKWHVPLVAGMAEQCTNPDCPRKD